MVLALRDRITSSLTTRCRVERLGRGRMAAVYLATDLKQERQVAIKVLLPELAGSLASGRFLHEITLAVKLSHPHILSLYDSGETNGLLYCVMPSFRASGCATN